MSDWSKKLKKLNDEYKSIHKNLMKESEKCFEEAVADVFIKHPDLKQFSFVMYTPAFNDGDPCYFRVDFEYCQYNDEEDNEKNGITNEAQKTITDNLSLFPDDFYENKYGTAAKLTCFRDGRIVQNHYDCGY